MIITTIGRGNMGGTLARLWSSAGHEVTTLGRDGGDASGSDVVLLVVPNQVVPAALAGVTGLARQVVIDATNRLDGGDRRAAMDRSSSTSRPTRVAPEQTRST
jgi:8-hydroxy-5-deazaflavin:NADPH oxidoreductase